jgi:hypothetical protein
VRGATTSGSSYGYQNTTEQALEDMMVEFEMSGEIIIQSIGICNHTDS